MNKVVLKAEDLDGFLTEADKTCLADMDGVYREALGLFDILGKTSSVAERKQTEDKLIALYNDMGLMMQDLCRNREGIAVGRIFLYLLGHNHRRKQRPPEHDAHHRILNAAVNIGNFVHRVVLSGRAHRGFDDKVILRFPGLPPIGKFEKQLIGALNVVHKFFIFGVQVPKFGDEPGRFGVATQPLTEMSTTNFPGGKGGPEQPHSHL